ncbi:TMV resistance protein N-like [Arabidopsis thaliana]|uniref:Isoform 2 of Probable disease resistance protein At4g19530 n=1 Tax=Arabidopsis thaliana TaxID=3702 RepID=O49471-2|nr:disease resistance protein (TIR-NBS-LRR class) family [Arabidopsis thaliana]AEE84195.1 disease resistance protein (TIR-NBS-LRR class) family [Arabidopsis thaliana]CAA16930.1 TMV resistance protein N-like [Arabidopsis thaliana]CAB78955.1 TMV resistance protein N-like [Arabidopsis thaliana]|eukprot:NP_193688.1 disease resistance protein (TIR-NBS-LRR class) family [Arabidopsis thaliana]
MATSSSVVSSVPQQHQVFLNFRGDELRNNFVSHLDKALRGKQINVFIDEAVEKGENLDNLFKEIEKSRIALAIISQKYTESKWCLNELVKMKELEGKLVTIPIFYNVEPATVRYQKEAFGAALTKTQENDSDGQMKKWKEALTYVSLLVGFPFNSKSKEKETTLIDKIVDAVLQKLSKISSEESTSGSVDQGRGEEVEEAKADKISGLNQRLKELEEKVAITGDKRDETRIVEVVGMPGIGKSTLLKAFYETWKTRFLSSALLQNISELVKAMGLGRLTGMLLKELLPDENIDEETYEPYKEKLLKNTVFIVLDGISDETHIQKLLKDHRKWAKKGSKIVIARRAVTRDLLHEDSMVRYTYFVPLLSHRDGLNHFCHYAFRHFAAHQNNKEAFMKESKEFVRYARGHPLILKLLGEELREKSLSYWEEKLKSLPKSLSQNIRDRVLQVTYDELSQVQKDAFLDIACFRSHDLVYVKSLLDSSGPAFSKATVTIDALKDMFMIYISDSRVEMHDLLYTFAMELGPEARDDDGRGRHRIWHHHNQDNKGRLNRLLKRPGGSTSVRSFFLDMYVMKTDVTLGTDYLKNMRNLRYLKFYSSHCPQECTPKENIHIPGELELPLEEVRCLHWLNFPKDELPQDFIPKNLVDLKLPYSKIRQIWREEKDAPKLRWVDLNHSSKLENLSGLSQALNLERLNLEGCTALKTLLLGPENMASLVFLNLKGCTGLESLPKINLRSLKTLILSNCSNLEEFWVISETLYTLYLDGTAIKTLPQDMVKLTSLVKLYMKDCEMLVKLPEEFDKLKVLQELVCSGCKRLSSLPDVMKNMQCLQILLLDGTAITKIPHISSLERLCLSRNEKISCLSNDIRLLSQLKWLDLKYCTKLVSIPELPTNLQCLDANGCESLTTVANPLATHLPTEQIHSTFIFTNCDKLDRTAKEGFVPEALFSTCFPGCEVPSWFCHEAVGSVLKLNLLPHWNENRFVGIALCAVVGSLPNCQEQTNSCSVTCTFNIASKDSKKGDPYKISFDRLVGRWNKHGNKLDKKGNKLKKTESDHVFICYTRCSNSIKCLQDQHSGTCTPTEAFLEFGVTDKESRLEVLKCGLRLVYASDEPQKTNSDMDLSLSSSDSTPTRNGSSNTTTSSGSVSTNTIREEDSNILHEAQSQNGRGL